MPAERKRSGILEKTCDTTALFLLDSLGYDDF